MDECFFADLNIRIYFVAPKEGVAILMQALLTEWRRNTTNCICPASGYKTLPAVVNILILMVFLGTTITSVKAMVVTSGTDNDRVLKLLLKKLSFKSGTGWQRRSRKCRWLYFRPLVRAIQPSLPLLSYAEFCHPTVLFSTFGWFVWALFSCHPTMLHFHFLLLYNVH